MKGFRLGTLVVGAVCALTAPGSTEVGLCEHVTRGGSLAEGRAMLIRSGVFEMCRNAGVKTVRADFEWRYVELADGTWYWTNYDNVIKAADAAGIELLPILGYDHVHSGVRAYQELENWSNFVFQAVSRYRGKFKAVEVWNEENHEGFWANPDPADYIRLLKVSYQAVKAADPSVRVVMGGLAGRCDSYFTTLLRDGRDWFDIVAIHPYNWGYAPDYKPSQTIWEKIIGKSSGKCPGANGMIDEFLAEMGKQGVSKPVWITECGYPTHAEGQTEANQSAYIRDIIAHAEAKGIERVYVYEFRAPESNTTDPEQNFGIVHADLTPKPAYTDLAKALCGNGWTNPYANYVFLCAEDIWGESSFADPNKWSNLQVPSSAADCLVDLGYGLVFRSPHLAPEATFGGRSLTIGRRVENEGDDVHMGDFAISGAKVTVDDLRLVKGQITFAGGDSAANRQMLAGTVTVRAPELAPFLVRTTGSAPANNAYPHLTGTLKGAVGTALRFKPAAGWLILDVLCDFDGSNYKGIFVAEGKSTTVRFTSAALQLSGSKIDAGVVLKDGAKLAPASANQTLSCTTRGISAETGTEICVAAGETLTLEMTIYGTVRKTGAGTLVFNGGGRGRIDVAEGTLAVDEAGLKQLGTVTGGTVLLNGATYDVPTGRTTFGADTFEEAAVGASADSLAGWTGGGEVVAAAPVVGDPPGFPVADATHVKALSVADATRTYGNAFARDDQAVDFLFQVDRARDALFDGYEPTGAEQFAIGVDGEGFLRLLHADADGRVVWTRLEGLGAHASGEWLRLALQFDYKSVPGTAFVRVRENGSCCVGADGLRSPTDLRSPGSWFRMPAAAVSAQGVSALDFRGEGILDDVVHTGFPSAAGPGFEFGSATSVGGMPFAWFDGYGIARDPQGDPDHDGADNFSEWQAGKDPLDPASRPNAGCLILIR